MLPLPLTADTSSAHRSAQITATERHRALALDLRLRAFHFAPVLNLGAGSMRVAGLVLLLFVLGLARDGQVTASAQTAATPAGQQNSTPGAAPAAKAPDATPAGAAAGQSGTTPKTDATAGPTTAPTTNATAAAQCKNVTTKLSAGDSSALQSMSSDQRIAAMNAAICLALADDNSRYCDALPADKKSECVDQWKFVRELKGAPQGNLKALTLHHLCLKNGAKADCDKVRDAMTAADASKCKGISNPQQGVFCGALATGDAAKCSGLPEGADRELCAALATDDPARCPKDSTDCPKMVGSFAKVKKEGLQGTNDPRMAALRNGKAACQPLMADLERSCMSAAIAAAAPPTTAPTTNASPKPTP